MATLTPVEIRAGDIPETLAEAMRSLPGFILDTRGWEEQDLDNFPSVGAAQYGEVGDVEVNVVKLRSGDVQLNFCAYVEMDGEDELVMNSVSWLFPSTLSAGQLAGVESPILQFQAQGHLHFILQHSLLLSVVRVANDLLGRMLFGQPKQFMSHPASCYRIEDERLVPHMESDLSGSAFMREFTFRVAMAPPYYTE